MSLDSITRCHALNNAFDLFLKDQKKSIIIDPCSRLAGITTDKKLRTRCDVIAQTVIELLRQENISEDDKIKLSIRFEKFDSIRFNRLWFPVWLIEKLILQLVLGIKHPMRKAIDECELSIPGVASVRNEIFNISNKLPQNLQNHFIKNAGQLALEFSHAFTNIINEHKKTISKSINPLIFLKSIITYLRILIVKTTCFAQFFRLVKLIEPINQNLIIELAKKKIHSIVAFQNIFSKSSSHLKVFSIVSTLINEDEEPHEKTILLNSLFALSKNVIDSVNLTLRKLCDFDSDSRRYFTLNNLKLFSSSDISKNLLPVLDYALTKKKPQLIHGLLQSLPGIPENQKKNFILQASRLHCNLKDDDLLARDAVISLKNILCIKNPASSLPEAFINYPFLKNFEDKNVLKSIFSFLANESIRDPCGLLDIFLKLKNRLPALSLEEIHSFLIGLLDIRPAEFDSVLLYAETFSKTQGCKFSADLIKAFAKLNEEEREEFSLYAAQLSERIPYKQHLARLMNSLASIAKDKREEMLAISLAMKKDINTKNIQNLNREFAAHPDENLIIEIISGLLGRETSVYTCKVINYLQIIPPEFREKYLDTVSELDSDVPFDILLSIFSSKESVREAIHAFFNELFENDSTPEEHFRLARKIFKYQIALGLDDEHPLTMRALAQIFVSGAEDLKNSKNPYHVYQKLKTVLAEEHESIVAVSLKTETIEGLQAKWKQQKPCNRPKMKYMVKDLPPEVSKKTIHDLFNQFNVRLACLSSEDQEVVQQEIKKSCQVELKSLQENLLLDPFIISLLNIGSKPTDLIPPAKLYLYRILKAIQDNFSDFTPAYKLSKGEDMLLKFSLCIQECETGRYDGLVRFYNLLPMEYKLTASTDPSQAIWNARCALHESVQRFLRRALSNFELHQTTAEISNDSQSSHINLYLSNRLGPQIGLNEPLKFDLHTEVLTEELLEKDCHTLLSDFYHHSPLSQLVNTVVEDSRGLLKPNVYEGVVELIKTVKGNDIIYGDYFEEEESTKTFVLTKLGALTLLQAIDLAVVE